jgi:hypothetical protein
MDYAHEPCPGRALRSGALDDLTLEPEPVPREQPDVVVQWIVDRLRQIQDAVNWPVYSRLARYWVAAGRPGVYINYVYAAGWAVTLIALIVLTVAWPGFAIAAALIASYRFIEIWVWYVKLLFDSGHYLMVSAERNLLFLTIDAAATVVIVGLWLAAVPGNGSAHLSEWRAALETFTLNGTPAAFTGWQADLATALGTLGGLLLIGAGLALLVGLLSKRFRFGPAESYIGSVRPQEKGPGGEPNA